MWVLCLCMYVLHEENEAYPLKYQELCFLKATSILLDV